MACGFRSPALQGSMVQPTSLGILPSPIVNPLSKTLHSQCSLLVSYMLLDPIKLTLKVRVAGTL